MTAESPVASGVDLDLSELAADRALLGRTSTAERVAAILRERIAQGLFRPGVRLSEERIGGALGVSRNTLREAFRLLTHERLLVHRLNRGTFVRVLEAADIVDIYRVRRLVECAAVRGLEEPPFPLEGLRAALREGEESAERRDWAGCATANIHFHQAVAGLAQSVRTDDLMRGVLAELRLAFHVMGDPRRFHEPYLTRNRELLGVLEKGDAAGAERMLGFYLEDSRRQLIEAYAESSVPGV
ncbi:GntR family transcriptional regulator [Streptomyces sp. RKND-216]|uniref:GntR family transcriptional regulator n=1 Tax=Streptomyces sp. RKND-216 TaxID=2562581 RepID=UPI00109DEFBA|nr:GntR family transcriptional regulator [Streptomyces sp. RKND-216]THA25371.1 GntR family transcriptional regulator [Streptomyces sp. RKND-216]